MTLLPWLPISRVNSKIISEVSGTSFEKPLSRETVFQRRGVGRGGIPRTLLQGYQLVNVNQMNQRFKWLKDHGQFYLDVALSRKKGPGKDG